MTRRTTVSKHPIAAILVALLTLTAYGAQRQLPDAGGGGVDNDRDGLSDGFELALLAKFLPTFMISNNDCSVRPAQFSLRATTPDVVADDGTIYGQVFPSKQLAGEVELHYYHLWRKDCGEMGHRLDAEHVSVLVSDAATIEGAKAKYWYAAAHEDTICDASQLTRAETIGAEAHGATVWISAGKHASFLSEALCSHGCGGDTCSHMEALSVQSVVNLGEWGAPMNGILWLASPAWPLSDKLRRSDFIESRVERLQRLPATDISWANPSKRPAQATILGAHAGVGGAATGARATDTALAVANSNTSTALGQTADGTRHALGAASRNVWRALHKSVEETERVLVRPKKP
jgi:hypothetical protein